MYQLLLVEDDPDFSWILAEFFILHGFSVLRAESARNAIALLKTEHVDAVITDIYLNGDSGLEVLEYVAGHLPEIPTLIMTGNASTETAIRALQLRATEYLKKPFDFDDILKIIWKMVNYQCDPQSPAGFAASPCDKLLELGIIGCSSAMGEIWRKITSCGNTPYNVLITGESGTGKELVANAIHSLNSGRHGKLVTINCATLTESLFASEMFGHKKGSFTGAMSSHRGYLEEAEGGTLFLDEIGDLSHENQTKLLRMLETGEYYPVGDTSPKMADVRIISATNRNIEEEVGKNNFRLDLYYRLNTFQGSSKNWLIDEQIEIS